MIYVIKQVTLVDSYFHPGRAPGDNPQYDIQLSPKQHPNDQYEKRDDWGAPVKGRVNLRQVAVIEAATEKDALDLYKLLEGEEIEEGDYIVDAVTGGKYEVVTRQDVY